MLKTKQPPRGSFDYLLKGDPWKDEAPRAPLPPSPERGGGPRVRVEIEIVQRPPARPRRTGSTIGAVILWVIIALVLIAGAHSQERWQSYQQGFTRHYQSDDGWSATSYRQGFTTYFDASGPNGESRHCRSWKQDWQTFTECD